MAGSYPRQRQQAADSLDIARPGPNPQAKKSPPYGDCVKTRSSGLELKSPADFSWAFLFSVPDSQGVYYLIAASNLGTPTS
ncbi:hypothetical protein, partial [Pseudohalioglobus sediminis]|uniref:hypothetical protein n=1 Tax=Pseudohalioglobus sediminis TaxID=2606449 RepID=UPI001CB70266